MTTGTDWFSEGISLSNQMKYEEAIIAFDKAIEIDPNLIDAWFNKGNILCKLGKYEDAFKAYNKVKEINPKDNRPWYADPDILNYINLRWARDAYETEFRYQFEKSMKDFDQLNSLSSETKNQIRPRIITDNFKIISLEAWSNVANEFYYNSISITIVFGLILTLVSILNWFSSNRSILEWVSVFFIGIVVFFVIIYFVSIVEVWRPQGVWWLLLIIFCLMSLRMLDLKIIWLPQVVRDGLRASFIGGATTIGILLATFYLVLLSNKLCWDYKNKLNPEEEVANSLLWTLVFVEKPWSDFEIKKQILIGLEWIAKRFENELPRKFSSFDHLTDIWQLERGKKMATGIRNLKQCVLMPDESSQEKLKTKLSKLLVHAINRNWDQFDKMEPGIPTSLFSQFLYILRFFVAMAFPLLMIVILKKYPPIPISDQSMEYIIAASIGWVVLNILAWLDPHYQQKIEGLKEIAESLKGLKKP